MHAHTGAAAYNTRDLYSPLCIAINLSGLLKCGVDESHIRTIVRLNGPRRPPGYTRLEQLTLCGLAQKKNIGE